MERRLPRRDHPQRPALALLRLARQEGQRRRRPVAPHERLPDGLRSRRRVARNTLPADVVGVEPVGCVWHGCVDRWPYGMASHRARDWA